MIELEIQEYKGHRLGYFKSEYKEKLKWMYLAGIINKKQYNEYLLKVDQKYDEIHSKMFG